MEATRVWLAELITRLVAAQPDPRDAMMTLADHVASLGPDFIPALQAEADLSGIDRTDLDPTKWTDQQRSVNEVWASEAEEWPWSEVDEDILDDWRHGYSDLLL